MKFDTALEDDIALRYRQDGWWADRTLCDYFDEAVQCTPSATAVVGPTGSRMTFAEVDEASRRMAANLAAHGLEQGDVISIQLPNWTVCGCAPGCNTLGCCDKSAFADLS